MLRLCLRLFSLLYAGCRRLSCIILLPLERFFGYASVIVIAQPLAPVHDLHNGAIVFAQPLFKWHLSAKTFHTSLLSKQQQSTILLWFSLYDV